MRFRAAAVISVLLVGLLPVAARAASVPNISASELTLPTVHSSEVPLAKRVVALGNGSAEIVLALGYRSILVGRDIASTMPELSGVPIDTDAHQVSVERVLSQNPDLILIDSSTSPTSALNVLRKAKIRIVMLPDSWTLGTVAAKELAVAKALGVPKAGRLLTGLITGIHNPKVPLKVAFLYLRGTAAIYLIGGKGSGADSLIQNMGFQDIGAATLAHPFNALSAEALIKMKPDVLLLMTKGLDSVGGMNGLVALPGIGQTPAGKNRRVVTVDDSLLLSFGPRTITLLPKLRSNILLVAKS
ncbi:MAG: ABC transporter substrate-binding protein [Actinomycetes bacterium]